LLYPLPFPNKGFFEFCILFFQLLAFFFVHALSLPALSSLLREDLGSYDRELMALLNKYLTPLQKLGQITMWSDINIKEGTLGEKKCASTWRALIFSCC